MENATISTVFGVFGAVCWSIQLIPQIILNYRRHSAAGLSAPFMLLWACAGLPLGVYNIVADFGIPLMIQPQILTSLSLVTWGQCYYYERAWPIKRVLLFAVPAACVMGGIEAGLVFALRHGTERGIHWPVTLMAVLAAMLLAGGVIEQYIAIFKNKSVEGISFLFCGFDALGDLTSIISVLFRQHLDILGLVIYGVELTLWIGIFALGFYFKFLPWVTQKLKKSRTMGETRSTPGQSRPEGLPDMPSSTSVFRTPSEHIELRQRRHDHSPGQVLSMS